MVPGLFGAEMTIATQLRDRSRLDLDAADALDAQAAEITVQAATIQQQSATIAALQQQIADLTKPVPPPPRDLSAADFHYLGAVKIPGVGMTCSGLAHDGSQFYTIANSGRDTFNLVSLSFDEAKLSPDAVLNAAVKPIGPMNVDNRLMMTGKNGASMKGLLWDAGSLTANFGSYYANAENLPFACRYDVATKSLVSVHTASIHSDFVKGMTLRAPPELGQPLVAFSVRGSTSQKQSWGLGLVGMDDPFGSGAKIISHWPLISNAQLVPCSDYPGDPDHPTTYLQSGNNGVFMTPIPGNGGPFMVMESACFINATTLFILGHVPHGHQWYGTSTEYLGVPSMLDPTKPTTSISSATGYHVEAIVPTWWMVRVSDIAEKIKARDQRISHYATGNVSELGGNVPLQSNSFGQAVQVGKRVYAICHGTGNFGSPQVLGWEVGR